MVTIKDVARLAGVSPATVSIVLNGKAQERKIPLQTCARIEGAMNTLGYRPNVSARRLRANEQSKPIVALYWPLDYRINVLAHLINALQNEIQRRNFTCEFIIQTYASDTLSQNARALLRGEYNAVLMGGLSSVDMEFLSSVPLTIPVVLINRKLDKVSSVGVNDEELVQRATDLFREKGYQEIGVICSRNRYLATNQRTQRFLDVCQQKGISIPESWILRTENRIDGGVRVAERFMCLTHRPRAVFCDSDAIAYGFASKLGRQGIRIPAELELLSVGSMLDSAYTEFFNPSISLVALPHDKIASSAISLMIDALEFGSSKAQHIQIDPEILLRESFSLD